jgi:hypothetical protein
VNAAARVQALHPHRRFELPKLLRLRHNDELPNTDTTDLADTQQPGEADKNTPDISDLQAEIAHTDEVRPPLTTGCTPSFRVLTTGNPCLCCAVLCCGGNVGMCSNMMRDLRARR